MFAISTDMKLGEICELQWKHVNLNDVERIVDGELIPARSVAVRSPSHRPALATNTPACKSRNIEIHEPLLSTLTHLSRQNQSLQSDDRVIVSDTGAPISANRKATLSGQLAKASGLPWLTWQVLRRTRSSFFADFLSQLSASREVKEKLDAASRLDRSDMRPKDRAVVNEDTYDPCRHRAFCFGRRRQGLTEDIPRD